ncbi:hypothetical protein Salat_2960600 [Sesamum alatum]|uniref:Uncharacterized protein n=1 Tax=Sesamum alatum TaxID=300844 RepID=A0AAE2C7Q0_9LAMI|nr:hypothetical protein Salat_2960600 [Sesamum alatum]
MACWIPARAATTSPASRFSCRPKCPHAWPQSVSCAEYLSRRHSTVRTSRFRLALRLSGRGAGWTSKHPLCPTSRARSNVLGLLAHCVLLDLSDAEYTVGIEAPGLYYPEQAFYASCERRPSPFWARPMRATESGEECYLVDPASSHMLVSKIKPCMCKYELIQTVKLRMAH